MRKTFVTLVFLVAVGTLGLSGCSEEFKKTYFEELDKAMARQGQNKEMYCTSRTDALGTTRTTCRERSY